MCDVRTYVDGQVIYNADYSTPVQMTATKLAEEQSAFTNPFSDCNANGTMWAHGTNRKIAKKIVYYCYRWWAWWWSTWYVFLFCFSFVSVYVIDLTKCDRISTNRTICKKWADIHSIVSKYETHVHAHAHKYSLEREQFIDQNGNKMPFSLRKIVSANKMSKLTKLF